MSLVAPRPVLLQWELIEKYGSLRSHYIAARPGITGPWQGAGRSTVVHEQRFTLDTTYIVDWELSRDINILVRTPLVVLARDGAD